MKYLDVSTLSTDKIHPVLNAAGLDSQNSTKATVVMWFLMDVFHSRHLLHKMKKCSSQQCPCCISPQEDIPHILLFCEGYQDIRETYLVELTFLNRNIVRYSDNAEILITAILDPESPKLPDDIRLSWNSVDKIYEISRNFCYNIYMKREKIIKDL